MSTWVYKRTEQSLWTVGYYAPDGEWNTDSDHGSPEEAAERARFLNGGPARDAQIRHLRERAEEYEGYYRSLADHVITKLNPPDSDYAEIAICTEAVDRVVAFVERGRCACALDAAESGVVCARCDALGRVSDRRVER